MGPGRRLGIPAIFLIGLAALVATTQPSTRVWLALAAAVVYPVIVMHLATRRIRFAQGRLGIAALVVAGAVVVASEAELGQAYFPFTPLGEARLSHRSPDASLALPDGALTVEVQTRGKLAKGGRESAGDYRYSLARGGQQITVRGELERKVGRSPRMLRRGVSNSYVVTHEVDRTEATLSGEGPVQVHLTDLSGGVEDGLVVTVLPLPISSRVAWAVCIALAIAALAVQTLAARAGFPSRFVVGACVACAFPLYMGRFYDPDDPFVPVLAGSFVAIVCGGLVGLLLTRLMRRWSLPLPPWSRSG